VVAPLRAENHAAWALAKSVARALAVQMAADAPAAYLTVADKDRRDGRIYLDYLRNDRTATAIAPLSPRGHAGAPVAMPLNWAQVRVGLDPSRFTLRTAARALARARPWTDYGDTAGSLAAAAQKLRV
jgi:bifunctional non-homologous end joining protein LigD